ncbi:hypothetical protein C3486_11770 [Streptomyces sp. Ru73]|uniref:hypothetical protein n=1 Tax=Streptomyces sp. Ru73 TaxID=2080748 RepID=UPI000CDE269D|nr:hypothetical protein [Streptomyces sp. Ru73]POX40863.1 hypothetical protein C3486_11770 [Streptomyces sp. Ru73]
MHARDTSKATDGTPTRPAGRVPVRAAGPEASVLALQRAAGNAAVSRAVQRVRGAGAGASKQGEHVFNALDALAMKVYTTLKDMRERRVGELNEQVKSKSLSREQAGRAKAQTGVKERLEHLRTHAEAAGAKRDHPRFRSAMQGAAKDAGGDQNSRDYSELSNAVMAAVGTCGTRQWNGGAALERYRGAALESVIIDQVARTQLRDNELPKADRKAFETWFEETRAAMHALFDDIIGTADAVHEMLRVTRRGAGGYPDRGRPGADELSDTDAEPDAGADSDAGSGPDA